MKVVIRFKNGFELPITCEKFKLTKSSACWDIMGYDIEGIEDNKPLFFRPDDVLCIYQILNEDGKENAAD